MKRVAAAIICAVLLCLILTGCWPMGKSWEPGDKKKVYGAAHQQLAPQPVYNRLRNVELPYVMPPQNVETAGEKYFPVVHLELKNARLEEAAAALADLARYHSYCSGSIADRRISVNTLGTLDELAAEIETKSKIKVVVDHDNRAIRFLAGSVAPAFSDNEVSGHESKQAY